MSKIALVTGGTRGIGEAISVALKNAGYTTIANYAGNDKAAEAFRERTGIAVTKFDVSNYDACFTAVKNIEEQYGAVDVLINNAGVTRDNPLHRMSPEDWKKVIDTDLGSCFNMCRSVIEGMRERQFGRIVNIGSANAESGQYGQVNYAAAKSGIHGFTKSLALECAKFGITVNALAPGYIATEMLSTIPERVMEKIIDKIPVHRLGQPEEIARGVVFLTADDAGFITGSTMNINGGQYMM